MDENVVKNEVLAELEYRSAEGALRFKDVRYLLIRPETLASCQKSLELAVGFEQAGEILYGGGFTGGRLSGQRYKEVFRLDDHEAVAFMCRMGGQIGWGRFQLLELDSKAQRFVVAVYDSPFASAYDGSAAAGVCHLLRGVLGGLGSGLFGVAVQARETRCLACGDDHCRFEIEAIREPSSGGR